uniref:Putative capsid assembly protein n=1 Tax=viral metagenome TaxID=1070528 RepID=A0A6M3IW71_9ZZZZ
MEETGTVNNDNSEGTVTDWTEGLPDDFKTPEVLPTFQKYKLEEGEQAVSVPKSVLKSHIELNKLIGKKTIGNPYDEKLSPEDRTRIWREIGVPEKPEGYELKAPENLPEGMSFNDGFSKEFSNAAHKLGIPKSAVNGLFKWYNERQLGEFSNSVKRLDKFNKKSIDEIKKDWGDEYENNLQKADAAIEKLFGAEFKEFLKTTGLNSHPAIVRGCFNASKAIGEHNIITGEGAAARPSVTFGKILEMKSNPKYWDPSRRDPDYVKEVDAVVSQFSGAQ